MATEAESATLVDKLFLELKDSTLLATIQKDRKSSGVKVPPQTQQKIYDAIASGAYKTSYKGGGGGECFCVCGYCECKC